MVISMKVACIGNMNNNFFSLTRYLRDRGIDANLLLLNREASHFHPSADAYDIDYQKYTSILPWGNMFDFLKVTKEEINDSVKQYDFIIGCNSAPAFMHKIGRAVDIFVPFGWDIMYAPFFRFYKNPVNQINYIFFKASQKAGIREARFISLDAGNNEFENIISKLRIKDNRIKMAVPFIYTPIYNPGNISGYYDRSCYYKSFREIRKKYDFIVFHHARHLWKNVSDKILYKGNDKLVIGFANFVKKVKGTNPCLIMFEYGRDVAETKKLVQELCIEEHVLWFPLVSRKEIMIGISLADIGAAEFGMDWMSYGTAYEILAMGKPLMCHRNDETYKDLYPELYPMINASAPDEITNALTDYVHNREFYKKMGEDGRRWFQKYAVDYPMEKYLEIILEKNKGKDSSC